MLDEKDYKILNILKKNARLSTKDISKKTLIPITTVYNRIKKLEKAGIIKNYTVVLDDKKLGTISAYVLIVVDHKMLKEKNLNQHELAKKISRNKYVESASVITGSSDIIIKARVNNVRELDRFITTYLRNLNGVDKTETMVVLNDS